MSCNAGPLPRTMRDTSHGACPMVHVRWCLPILRLPHGFVNMGRPISSPDNGGAVVSGLGYPGHAPPALSHRNDDASKGVRGILPSCLTGRALPRHEPPLPDFSHLFALLRLTVCPSHDSARMLSYQALPTSIEWWRGHGQEAQRGEAGGPRIMRHGKRLGCCSARVRPPGCPCSRSSA
jgi:hypothetical protein